MNDDGGLADEQLNHICVKHAKYTVQERWRCYKERTKVREYGTRDWQVSKSRHGQCSALQREIEDSCSVATRCRQLSIPCLGRILEASLTDPPCWNVIQLHMLDLREI
jgi:hypothetical protein